jgi:outer membrane biosynthesis protein TonB
MLPLVLAPIVLSLAAGPSSSTDPDRGRPGALSKAEVYGVVKAHFMNVRACYERARAKNPTLNGTVVLAWSVEPDGRVSRARVAESTMNSMEVESCLVDEIAHWTFPKSFGKTPVARFPFVFKNRPPEKAPVDAGRRSLSNKALQRAIGLPRHARAAVRR